MDTAPLLTGPLLRDRAALALGLPLPAALGIRLVDEGDPAGGAVLEVGDLAANGAGGAHAGALSVLLEVAGYLALAPALTTAEHAVTHSAATTFVSVAAGGRSVRASGVLDRRTSRLAFVGVTAHVGDRVVARSTLVKSVVPFTG
ncbi:PaaI family thioesterase [Nocardioides sp. CFH 31398]|uniref:PaaI family thioesterase n=1 Tax=Nocardioides sp. CFH 31398 TaxID=2919579 RepID=UPI001F057C41|nr:hypothetical protein [Nocardioides sp. CFH 31398]MCH1866924.1 hypothetical protein [Nocardioides sp. CFH 31398]